MPVIKHRVNFMMGAGFQVVSWRRELLRRAKTWCLLVTLLLVSFIIYRDPQLLARDRYNESTKNTKRLRCGSGNFKTGNPTAPSGHVPSCGGTPHAEARKVWLEAEEGYSCLRDDKFTAVMQTYKRPITLETTLAALLSPDIPSLHEIVVIWNDVDSTPPTDFISPRGIPVRYHVPERNSLNNRFIPQPSYQTQAILSSDDDIWFKSGDLEFAFQVWRGLGRYRITGALPRCHIRVPQDDNRLIYAQCPEGAEWYSLVPTGLAFMHISFLDVYSSSLEIATKMRTYVDEKFNCEDLAMNYLVSMLTCTGPLHVMGQEPFYINTQSGGLSKNPDHMSERAGCMDYFEEVMGFFPLVEQWGSISRGVPSF